MNQMAQAKRMMMRRIRIAHRKRERERERDRERAASVNVYYVDFCRFCFNVFSSRGRQSWQEIAKHDNTCAYSILSFSSVLAYNHINSDSLYLAGTF